MNSLQQLSPTSLWTYFAEILQIPRQSKKEGKIIEYLISFSKKNNLKYKKDGQGNILISKVASKGFENRKKVILQSHIDMVCIKHPNTEHNFDFDPIQAVIEGDIVKSKGTTLGADNGIGVATQLAILSDKNIEHGPLDCLFTVDEETGLSGASALKPDFLNADILLNLDSEDEGEIFVGCAGGMNTSVKFRYSQRSPISGGTSYQININNLRGGHSGDDIDKGRANAIKLLARFLWEAYLACNIRLAEIDGGSVHNAIPANAMAKIMIKNSQKNRFFEMFQNFSDEVKAEYEKTEPDMSISLSEISTPPFLIDKTSKINILNALYVCPHGVLAMSPEIVGLVETSSNLATIHFQGKYIEIVSSQRSSVESAKKWAGKLISAVFTLARASRIDHSVGYPAWKPNLNSEVLGIVVDSYTRLFATAPKVRAIHAGLECGLFVEKNSKLDMVSFGPTIRAAHSPDEYVDIPSTLKFWNLLIDVLKNIPAK